MKTNTIFRVAAIFSSVFTFGCQDILKDFIGLESEESEEKTGGPSFLGESEGTTSLGGMGGTTGNSGTGSDETTTGSSTDSCTFFLYLFDDYGDGWNGAALEVYEGNEYVGSVECMEGEELYEFSSTSGTTLTFEFSSGEHDEEIFYGVFDSNEEPIFTVTAPNDGHTEQFTVSCDGSM